MKSMTIHGIDKQLAEMRKAKAEAEGSSINKTIKQLLETALADQRCLDCRPCPGNRIGDRHV